MNNTETIIKYLKLYNEWRRGDEKMGQPNPTEIGKLIDEACEMLISLERERDEAREALMAFNHDKKHLCDSHKDMIGNCMVCSMNETK